MRFSAVFTSALLLVAVQASEAEFLGISFEKTSNVPNLFKRGDYHVERVKEEPRPLSFIDHNPVPHTGHHDSRDYNRTHFGDKDPYADCEWPQYPKKLDTAEYQRLPAKCKLEVVWRNCLEDQNRERFFVGPELQSLFDIKKLTKVFF